jgi:hypothetical protein
MLAPLVLLVWTALSVYGLLAPWSGAVGLLQRDHPANVSLLTGVGYHSITVDGVHHVEKSANYLLFPDSFKSLSTFSVRESDGKLSVEESPYGLFVVVGFYVAFIVGTGLSWRRSGNASVPEHVNSSRYEGRQHGKEP